MSIVEAIDYQLLRIESFQSLVGRRMVCASSYSNSRQVFERESAAKEKIRNDVKNSRDDATNADVAAKMSFCAMNETYDQLTTFTNRVLKAFKLFYQSHTNETTLILTTFVKLQLAYEEQCRATWEQLLGNMTRNSS